MPINRNRHPIRSHSIRFHSFIQSFNHTSNSASPLRKLSQEKEKAPEVNYIHYSLFYVRFALRFIAPNMGLLVALIYIHLNVLDSYRLLLLLLEARQGHVSIT